MQILRPCSWRYCVHALQFRSRNICMGGCLGGYVRPPPAAVPEKGTRPPGFQRRDSRRCSSNNAMGDNDLQHASQALQRFSQSLNDRHPSADSASHVPEEPSSENHALKNWHKQRQEWVRRSQKPQRRAMREPVIRWSATYEELLGTSRPFEKPVPLPEMVDFLVDVWEQEGLYG